MQTGSAGGDGAVSKDEYVRNTANDIISNVEGCDKKCNQNN